MTTPHSPPRIAVFCADPHLQDQTAELAARLGLPIASGSTGWGMLLTLETTGSAPGYIVMLQQLGVDAPGPIYVDFVGGKAGHRRRAAEGRKQPLARAAGLKHGTNPVVLDATGGLGRDAFVLATLGCSVQILERSPIVAALLHNGLQRAHADAATAPIMERMTLVNADARAYLPALSGMQRPDVIYLDPMYPHRDKSALVKKEMRVLRALLGDDDDAADLLPIARHAAKHRVVVKRPGRAPSLGGAQPSMRIENENTRFDVYLSLQ
ncbi:MAG: class I SAM-dependent methyltransferase [Gammaproteobacteria bacterium]|nr:class I SAM-dependent methyltransferase [Gammaproteobacteria bacterium]